MTLRHQFVTVIALAIFAVPAAAQSLRVPIELRDNMVFVAAKVNGRDARLKIDTGATASVFASKLLTVHNTKEIEVRTAGGMVKAEIGDARLELDGGPSFQLKATYLPNFIDDGVIGMDVLAHFSQVIFDFKAKEIELVPYH